MKHLRRLGVGCFCSVLLALIFTPPTYAGSDEQTAALSLAEAGEFDRALDALGALLAVAPEGSAESRSLNRDLGLVSAWSGRHADAVAYLEDIPTAEQPPDVLRAYARSLHLAGRADAAVAAYRELSARLPDDQQAALGVFYALMDAGRIDAAELELTALSRRLEGPELDFAEAFLAAERNRPIDALRHYDRVLDHEPENRQALRGKALAALALGAPWQALAISEQHPGLLNPDEHERAILDTAAMQLRWGTTTARDQAERIATADSALHTQERVLAGRDLQALDLTAPVERALLFDRIVALTQRFEMHEALELFEAAREKALVTVDDRSEPTPMPAYVLKAAADAHLYLKEPLRAEALYREALVQEPENHATRMGLFFALSDASRHDEARELLDETLATQPAWIRPTPKIWLENPAFAEATQIHAISPAYSGDYETSLDRLDGLLAIAPASQGARVSRAQVLRWRGWPRAAELEVGRTLGEVPDNVYAGTTHAHTLMDVYRFEEAGQSVSELNQAASHNPGVRSLVRRWQLHQRPELVSSAYFRTSDGDAEGSDEWVVDTLFYSAPIADRYRIYAHDLHRQASFSEGTGRDHRLGAGIEYRSAGLRLASELSAGLAQNDKAGLSLDGRWEIDDFWHVSARLAANSTEVPLRGTRVGVRGNELTVGGGYRWHEGRWITARAMVLDMNDDNLRRSLALDFNQRLRNGYRHRLYGRVEAYTSQNDDVGAVYFNPERDLSLTGGITHEWLIHQRYERSLVQRLGVDVGSYSQSGFGTGVIWTLRFEHAWQLSDALSVGYGASTGARVYDGETEHATTLFVSVGARL